MKFSALFLGCIVWLFSIVEAISNKKLLELSKKNGNVINLNSRNYEKILNSPRKSDIVVMFTASSTQFSCTLCNEMSPSFDVVANSWFYDHKDGISKDLKEEGHGLFFARADFGPDSKQLFSRFQLTSVPAFFVFKAGGKTADEFEKITITSELGGNHLGFLAGQIKYLTEVADLVVYEPINWGSTVITTVTVGVLTFVVRKFTSTVVGILTLRPLWGVLCSFAVITLISGNMFVKIRKPEFSGMSSNSVVYFLGGQLQNQYAIESQIVTILYSVLASAMVGLICVVPGIQKWYKNKNQDGKAAFVFFSLALAFSLCIYIFYSALVAVFALKNSGYPFKLLKNPLK
ncbi:Dolichyl-diphosphooligosaccharide--protein glycosyltransferase subunit 3 [Kluyveromyces marxianus]